MPGMMQPPAVTGSVSIGVNYQYISPELVFNGVGDRVAPDIVRYNSVVPFIVTGQASGSAQLRIIYPDGNVMQHRVTGPFSSQHVLSTGLGGSDSMLLRVELLDPNSGNVVAQAMKNEELKIVKFKFEDYFGKIGGQADSLVTSQVSSQLGNLFGPLLTDAAITEMAQQRIENDPTAFDLDLTKTLIRDEILSAKSEFAQRLESGMRIGLQSAIEGDQLDHHFAMGIGHPGGGEFGAAMAESKAAYNADFSMVDVAKMVKFSANLPSGADLQTTFSNIRTADDFLNMVDQVPVTVGIQGFTVPIRNGVEFTASSHFQSTGVLTGSRSLSEYEVGAGINFQTPPNGPPIFLGRRMKGSVGGFYRQFQNEGQLQKANRADADEFGVSAGWNY